MSGATIIATLMRAAPAITDIVPGPMIKTGRLPQDAKLPALLVRTVSSVERQKLKRLGLVRMRERIRVTVRTADRETQLALIKLVRRTCAGVTGLVAGVPDVSAVSILADGAGPDIDGPGNSFEQSQDFAVGFNEPA